MSVKASATLTAIKAPEQQQDGAEKPHRRGPGRPFTKGNTITRKGAQNKATAEARTWALPLVPEVLRWRRKHRLGCDAAKDCAMCRHYNDMVLHYAYGKPPQRTELIQAALKQDIGALAKAMGLSEDQAKAAVKDVEAQLATLKASQ